MMAIGVGNAANSFEAPVFESGARQQRFKWVYPTGDTTWLHPECTQDLEWKLRYSPEALTQNERMVLATALACYRELVRATRAWREKVVAAMKKVRIHG